MTDKLAEYEQLARDLARQNPDSYAIVGLARIVRLLCISLRQTLRENEE